MVIKRVMADHQAAASVARASDTVELLSYVSSTVAEVHERALRLIVQVDRLAGSLLQAVVQALVEGERLAILHPRILFAPAMLVPFEAYLYFLQSQIVKIQIVVLVREHHLEEEWPRLRLEGKHLKIDPLEVVRCSQVGISKDETGVVVRIIGVVEVYKGQAFV